MPYVQTINKIGVGSFTPEQHARTCDYWYYLQYQMMNFMAWNRRENFLAFLNMVGLKLSKELPPHGEHSYQFLEGSFRIASYMSYDEFYAVKPLNTTRWLDNAEYTLAFITKDEDGIYTVHHLNCNLRYRQKFDYTESRLLIG